MVRPLPSYTQMISPSPAPQGHDVRNRDQYIKLLAAAATSVIILSFWASVLFCFRPSPSAPSWITFECTYPRQEPVFTMPQDCPSNYAEWVSSRKWWCLAAIKSNSFASFLATYTAMPKAFMNLEAVVHWTFRFKDPSKHVANLLVMLLTPSSTLFHPRYLTEMLQC